MRSIKFFCVLTALLVFSPSVSAAELRVAVASNFAATASLLVELYAQINGDQITLLIGSTGKHAAQIQYGLDVDIFLAADRQRPLLLEQKGFAIRGSSFDYAHGQLVLWSSDPELINDSARALEQGDFKHLAIANPKLAPYGQASIELLERLGLTQGLTKELVRGDSVGQVFQFVSSGNAELGLLAYSQVIRLARGSMWLVPNDLHNPIVQTGTIIKDSDAAQRFVRFLQSEPALALIEKQGYLRP